MRQRRRTGAAVISRHRAIRHQTIVSAASPRPMPLIFPIWAKRIRTQVSSEDRSARVERMALEPEKAASRSELKPQRAPSGATLAAPSA